MKEHQKAEWKETWRDEYLRWICGFANAQGGVLEIGRNNRGVVVGVPDAAHGIAAPLFDYGMSGLMLTFKANPKHIALAQSEASLSGRKKGGEKSGDKGGDKGGENLTQNQKQILTLLRRNSHVSARELAGQIGINSRKVEQNIAKLKGAGWLRRTGPAKGGYWDVLK